MRKKLDAGKSYLKTDYVVHCKEKGSPCADHCTLCALSDPTNADFQTSCKHKHDIVCGRCESLRSVLKDIEEMVKIQSNKFYSSEQIDDIFFDLKRANESIFEWKAHILRSVHQDEAKKDVFEELDSESCVVVMDWAMKFLQLHYREKQSEWYGKRGLSWHISSFVFRNPLTKLLEVQSYAHLFDTCTQDWYAVSSIVEHLLQVIKTKYLAIKKVSLRSDEEGCYHNSMLIAAINDIALRLNMTVVSYDYSEPQYNGKFKDICDRIICPMKGALKKYFNEGNDILTAEDMRNALLQKHLKGATTTACMVDDLNTTLDLKKIKLFTRYHNISFENSGILVRRAYNIGPGKHIPHQTICTKHQKDTGLIIKEQSFFEIKNPRQLKPTDGQSSNTAPDIVDGCLFECPESGCRRSFPSVSDLELHLDLGKHEKLLLQENFYDRLRRDWAARYNSVIEPLAGTQMTTCRSQRDNMDGMNMGWALHKPRTGTVRFPTAIKQYLTQKFDLGETTGHKADPGEVVIEIRNARSENNEKMFSRDDWLTKTQIRNFFSRLAASRRKQQLGEQCHINRRRCQ